MKEVDEVKRLFVFLYICLLVTLTTSCNSEKNISEVSSSADWAYYFVIWNEDIYEIMKEEINPNLIDKELGEIKHYSDVEGMYSNGFSNKYPVGTKLYSIKDVETSNYIALQVEEGIYIKAIDKGKYGRVSGS